MNVDGSLWNYFINASIMVKAVMLILICASLYCWTYIIQRGLMLRDVKKATKIFEEKFWSGGDLNQFYQESLQHNSVDGVEAIFQAGFKEFLRHKQTNLPQEMIIENVKRAMHAAQTREQDQLELNLSWLATVGSISPYVGLFGTIWGIMLSFRGLAGMQQATISAVAPGIAEALIATAMGLFAAIPAVIAYNRFATEISRLLNRFDSFQEEFENILTRHAKMNVTRPETTATSFY